MITLIRPPDTEVLDAQKDPPFNLLFIASSLIRNDSEVTILDLGNENMNSVDNIAHAETFGITTTTPSYPDVLIFAQRLKGRFPNSKIILGGAHVNSNLKISGFDVVVKGECEANVSEIFNTSESMLYGEAPEELSALFPLPYHLLKDYSVYMNKRNIGNSKFVSVLLGRGCKFSCKFCVVNSRNVRYPSKKAVKSDIETLLKIGNDISGLYIMDDNFASYGSNYLDLFREFNLKFAVIAAIPLLSRKLIETYVEYGCVQLALGIESGSNFILKLMNKPQTVAYAKNVIELIKSLGLAVKIALIVGFPGESWMTIEETITFIKSLPLDETDSLHINPFVPYPSTEAFSNPEKYGIKWISNDWRDFRTKDKNKQFRIAFETDLLAREDILDMCNLVKNELVVPGALV